MGRDTSGVRGMNVSKKGNAVLAMDVARPGQDLLVVTENGFGKRTAIDDYPVKGRGTMGVKTIALTDRKGGLAGALVVREHEELVLISREGMVQRITAEGINRYGRASQGVKVMNMREDDVVSAVARVVDSGGETAAGVAEDDDEVLDEGWRRRHRARPRRPTARARPSDPRERRRVEEAPGPSPGAGTFARTRGRRWSVSIVPVLAGPWRCPAARRGWLDPTGGIPTGTPPADRPGSGSPGAVHGLPASSSQKCSSAGVSSC